MITITVQGEENEVRKWIARYQRIQTKKINYTGAKTPDGRSTYILTEGDKENCPRMRTVRKLNLKR